MRKEKYTNSKKKLRKSKNNFSPSLYQRNQKPNDEYLMSLMNKNGLHNLNKMEKGRRSTENLLMHRTGGLNINYKYVKFLILT